MKKGPWLQMFSNREESIIGSEKAVPVFTVITPCLNAGDRLEETVMSVIGQSALRGNRARLQYIIMDGGSSDRTASIISRLNHPDISYYSSEDAGIYDALSKGLKFAHGDYVSYLNAGDYYHPQAFDVLLEVFQNSSTSWVTGMNVFYNENSQVIDVRMPYRYRKRLFDCGMYSGMLPYVQQESTFWKATLLSEIDMEVLSSFKLAGDYYLWKCFSGRSDLVVVASYLGGFKFHHGQLSTNKTLYVGEVKRMTQKPSLLDWLIAGVDRLIWSMPTAMKKRFSPRRLLRYDIDAKQWR